MTKRSSRLEGPKACRLRERIQDLMQRMAEMAKGIRDEHLNQEALENVEKQQDLLSQLSDIQRKLQSGKIDDALKQLDQLGQKLADLEKNLSQRANDQQRGQYAEEAKQLAQAAQKLKDLEARERQLAQRTAELRKKAQSAAQNQAARSYVNFLTQGLGRLHAGVAAPQSYYDWLAQAGGGQGIFF